MQIEEGELLLFGGYGSNKVIYKETYVLDLRAKEIRINEKVTIAKKDRFFFNQNVFIGDQVHSFGRYHVHTYDRKQNNWVALEGLGYKPALLADIQDE